MGRLQLEQLLPSVVLILLAGCVSPQEAMVQSTAPPATMPDVSEIDSIEVVFGDQTRVLTDRQRIEGFVSFVNSLDSGWKEVSSSRASPLMGWKIFVKSNQENAASFALCAGDLIWHVFSSPTEHVYRGRELNESEYDRLVSLLDLEADLESIN